MTDLESTIVQCLWVAAIFHQRKHRVGLRGHYKNRTKVDWADIFQLERDLGNPDRPRAGG